MDLDEVDGSSEAAARPRKFAPGRAGKPKPKPKPEPKLEPAVNTEPPPHLNAHVEAASKGEQEADVKFSAPRSKCEPAVYNGAVKMEIDSAVQKEPETTEAELMDEVRDEQQPPEVEEEQDLVVREIDVFLNPSIGADTKLYVLQYPLRPSWRPYELDERCEEVRVKPFTAEVEVDLSIDVNSNNYDKEFGSKLRMTKQTLTTNWRQPPAMDYAVGVLMGDKLHLNLVQAVSQLRPSMDYFSSVGKKKQTAAESFEESVGPSKKQIKGMQSSMEQKTVHEETWVKLKYHGLHSELYSRYLPRMMAHGSSTVDFSMSLDDYVNSLCPGGISRSSRSNGPSQRFLLSLPLEERMQKLLCERSPLLRYSVLKHYAPDYSDEDVLRVLQQLGLLVQGLWAPKTRLLNLDGPLAGARDYVLTLFSKEPTVKYSQVDAAGRNRDRVKEILSTLAKERPLLNDWKFKETTDVSFIKRYPDIVQNQEVIWKSMEEKIMPLIRGARVRVDSRRNINTKPAATVKPEKPLLSDKGASGNSPIPRFRRTISEETRRALPRALKKVFQTHKVCSLQMICQGLRDLAVSKSNNPKADSSMEVIAAFGADAPLQELQEVVSEVAVNIHGSYVLKSSPDHPEFDPLRKVVIDLLCGMGPGARLKRAEVLEAGKSVLGREITNHEYNKVMTDFCETNGAAWVLQTPR